MYCRACNPTWPIYYPKNSLFENLCAWYKRFHLENGIKFGLYQELKFTIQSRIFINQSNNYIWTKKKNYSNYVWMFHLIIFKMKKMEFIYCNYLNLTPPIKAWSLYQILEGKRNYFYSTIQKNFNKLCFKLHSLCNNLCERKEIERTFFSKTWK